MQDPSDTELIYAMARGEGSALATLYDRHAGRLLSLCRRILHDSAQAEDVLHDVFVEAFAHAGDYDPARASALTWLLVRTRSRCIDRLRRTRETSDGTVDAWLEADACPLRALEHSELRHWLAALPEERRDALLLAYFGDLSSSEIAERLNIPIGTVKSRIRIALADLRSALTVLLPADAPSDVTTNARDMQEHEG